MPTDDRTPNLDLPLPHKSNVMEDDVARVRTAFTTIDSAIAGKVGTQELANAIAAAVGQAVVNLLGGAPANLNTHGKLAAAIGNDPSFADNIAASLAQKLGKDPATASRLGGVKVGSGIAVTADGTISVAASEQPSAVGLAVYKAVDQAAARTAIGAGTGNSNFSGSWNALSGKPTTVAEAGLTDAATKATTLAGYGITDGATKANPALTGIISADGSMRSNKVDMPGLTVDCSLSNSFAKSISANSTITFGNVPAAPIRYGMVLEIALVGGVITWPSSVVWPGGPAPQLTAGKTHLIFFVTSDGGNTWRASPILNYGA